MMDCRDWEGRIALHVGGDLAADEAAAVERHLAECAECRVMYSGMKESLELLQRLHAEPLAPGCFTAVRGRVTAELARRRAWWRRQWVAGLAAVVVLLAVALASWPGRRVESPPGRKVQVAQTPPPSPPLPTSVVVRVPVLEHRIKRLPPHEKAAAAVRQPLLVRLVTDDPNVVIYWIAD